MGEEGGREERKRGGEGIGRKDEREKRVKGEGRRGRSAELRDPRGSEITGDRMSFV